MGEVRGARWEAGGLLGRRDVGESIRVERRWREWVGFDQRDTF